MRVEWPQAWRIIASRYPPIDLFERVSDDPAVWEVLIELEQLTNPRVRDEVGAIRLVPPERRVTGLNASWVMAAFTHVNPKGSRFADGTFGAYYAANRLDTAIRETAHHFARFAADSADPPRRETMRVLVGVMSHRFDDLASLPDDERRRLLDPDDYSASQAFARDRRSAGSDGIVYQSVRDPAGTCLAVFWPDVVGRPRQERHLVYEWDGTSVRRYFDHRQDQWLPLAPTAN